MKNIFHQFVLIGFLMIIHCNMKAGHYVNKSFQYSFMMDQDTLSKKYIEELNSPEESIRSNAASQLCKMKHPMAVAACIRTINDLPDINHLDYTPSVHCLVAIGKPAVLPLTELLFSAEEDTRWRAYKAIETITFNMWSKPNSKNKHKELDKWREWWKGIDLNYNGSPDEKKEAVKKLKAWLSNQK